MKYKNRFFELFVIFLLSISLFGCQKRNSELRQHDGAKVKVVATIFPLYDWTKNVVKDTENISLELLIKNGVDLHSFQPSASDIVKIATCDVLIYVGGESDFWIGDALKNATNKNMLVINLMQELSDSIKEEETIEGMTSEEQKHENALQFANHEHDEVEYDEHLWLSVKNAELATEKIASALSEKDKSEAELIEENKDKYLEMLKNIKVVSTGSTTNSNNDEKTIIVCDRFPFRYMTDELGIKYYAAFVGCSAETEASFETVVFLANKIKELGANEVFVTESSDKKIAKTVIKNAGLTENECKIVTLNSMQATTLKDAENGANYIDIMKENYKKLGE